METIAVRLPEKLVTQMDSLVQKNIYSNRGEILRLALRNYYMQHFSQKKGESFDGTTMR